MDVTEIKAQVRNERYFYSVHADFERKADNLTLTQVESALLNGLILEHYPDSG
jgi:hypothetical protein